MKRNINIEQCSNKKIKITLKKDNEKTDINIKNQDNSDVKQIIKNRNILNYFNKYTTQQKESFIKEYIKLNDGDNTDKPYIFKLTENKKIPMKIKKVIYNKIKIFMLLNKGDNEYYKLNKWIDNSLKIPYNNDKKLSININKGTDKCKKYIDFCINKLDEIVYGMNDAKSQFIQLIAKIILNPKSIGQSIALKGPMGTGKTTLLKGISKILNRDLVLIPLGGASDGSYLEGHSYTYEGSTYGKIVDLLIQCKSSNPIIFFDELDKVSNTYKGDEIIGILTHITDSTQNTEFYDKYFSEISIDLSRCLFVFSYNEEHKVNKILKDRLYVIETNGYNIQDKIMISTQYLIPNIQKELKHNEVIFNNNNIQYIIEKTTNEKGVRNLKRSLEIIITKLNLFTILSEKQLKKKELIFKNIKFPFKIDNRMIDILLQPLSQPQYLSMYL